MRLGQLRAKDPGPVCTRCNYYGVRPPNRLCSVCRKALTSEERRVAAKVAKGQCLVKGCWFPVYKSKRVCLKHTWEDLPKKLPGLRRK